MIRGLHKGKNAWMTIVMHIVNVFRFAIYCLIQTFDE
jgi:hypothetical protein